MLIKVDDDYFFVLLFWSLSGVLLSSRVGPCRRNINHNNDDDSDSDKDTPTTAGRNRGAAHADCSHSVNGSGGVIVNIGLGRLIAYPNRCFNWETAHSVVGSIPAHGINGQ